MSVRGGPSRLAGAAWGLGVGALAGATWALGERGIAWAAGSVAPAAVWRTIAAWDVGLGAVVGAVAGALTRRRDAGGVALAVVFGFGLARIVSPPGFGGEALYVGLALTAWWLGRNLVAEGSGSVLTAVHVSLLGLAAIVGGGLALDVFRVPVPRGAALLAAVMGAPVVLLALDRAASLLLPGRSRRLLLEAAAAVLAGAIVGRPLDVTPLVDEVVTAVPPPRGTPDVVVVTLDTTRADHLSTYGYERETSPNLTRFAADAVLYREARSPAAWTLPGHASMMTGLFPRSHGAHLAGGWLGGESIDGRRNVAHPLSPSHETLAELLRDRGYRSAAFVANFSYLYRDYGLAQGFGVYDDAPGLLLRVEPPVARLVRLLRPAFAVKPFRTARDVNAAALEWLDAQDRSRPSFVFLNYMEPHQPWVAEAPYDRWAREVPGGWTLARTNLYSHAVREVAPETAAFVRANYDGQIAAMDAALGEFLDALRARGRYENAVIVVTADHGELLGEHSEMGHMGRTLWEPLLRIPLVVKYPGPGRPRGLTEHPVQLVDVVPTVVALAGARLPSSVEGVGLGAPARVVYAEEGINPFLVADYGAFYDRAMRVVYDGPYKLLATSRGEKMLFDLAADPGETHDLAGSRPERVAHLEGLLADHGPEAIANAAAAVRHVRDGGTP